MFLALSRGKNLKWKVPLGVNTPLNDGTWTILAIIVKLNVNNCDEENSASVETQEHFATMSGVFWKGDYPGLVFTTSFLNNESEGRLKTHKFQIYFYCSFWTKCEVVKTYKNDNLKTFSAKNSNRLNKPLKISSEIAF